MHSIPMAEQEGGEEPPEDEDYSPAPPLLLTAGVPTALAGLRLDQALAKIFPQHSRSRMQNWVREARVLIDGTAAEDAKRKVWGGEQLVIHPAADPAETAFKAEAISLNIVYEDEDILVIDKSAGNWEGTLLNGLLHHAPQTRNIPRAGIVHRLDKDTTGLLVSAKTLEAQTDLVRQLQARSVKREYLALVHGRPQPESGVVDAAIGRHPVERTRMAVTAQGKPARTRYRVLENFDAVSLLECSLDTGRTHQIRVHMQSIGHPLVGDPVYGQRNIRQGLLTSLPRQALHAARLGLVHPASGAAMFWESPMPADFEQLLQALR
jgi:23S rRNA pseudouridine1911/1915/1917 synthase